MIHLTLGSVSALKKAATKAALEMIGQTAVVDSRDIASGVPAQPIGEETVVGATNRAKGAKSGISTTWGLGIENGLFFERGVWRDRAVIVLISPNEIVWERRSCGVIFPFTAVTEARRRGFTSVTAGSIIAEYTGCDAADPHTYLTNGRISRTDLLTTTLILLFREALLHTTKGTL